MNHNYYVPDFELTDQSGNPASTTLSRPPNKSAADTAEEDMMELLWQDGHVVFQSQNQRSHRKPNTGDAIIMPPAPKQIPQEEQTPANLFMQEDEMTTWLHYPLHDTPFDRDLYADFLYYPNRTPPSLTAASSLPPPPPPHADHHLKSEFKPPTAPAPLNNFTHFSRYRGMAEQGGPSISNQTMARQLTVVDSSDTPALMGKAPESRISHVSSSTMTNSARTIGGFPTAAELGISSAAAAGETDVGTCDFTVSSSPSGSAASASVSVEPTTPKPAPPVKEDRKRKGRAAAAADDDAECQNQDIDVNYSDVKKRACGSTSTKKSRAAEVHNLSERKRRDRINEKMKALQELIPRCNKSDKASMLDEAIEYLKSLQLQVQMMSMGCTMVPMMFPGIQHYMPTVGMGMGMGIGPGMGMTRPMMQFPPHVHPGSSVQGQSSTSHMAPRFPTSAFPLPPPGAAIPDSNRIQATNLPESVMNSAATQNLSHPQMQNVVVDPYQQYYLNTNQSRVSMFAQNPTVMQQNTSEPGGSGSSSNHRNYQSG